MGLIHLELQWCDWSAFHRDFNTTTSSVIGWYGRFRNTSQEQHTRSIRFILKACFLDSRNNTGYMLLEGPLPFHIQFGPN